MAERRPHGGTLSVQRAFVVHFASVEGGRRRFIGRVEHLSSGRAIHFSSLAELLRFMAPGPDAPTPSRKGGTDDVGHEG